MAPSLALRMTSIWPQLCPIWFLLLIIPFPSLASFSTVHSASRSRKIFSFLPNHTKPFGSLRSGRTPDVNLGVTRRCHSSYHSISEPSVLPELLNGASDAPLRLVERCERRLVLHSKSCCYR